MDAAHWDRRLDTARHRFPDVLTATAADLELDSRSGRVCRRQLHVALTWLDRA